jgi:hypothetical protein
MVLGRALESARVLDALDDGSTPMVNLPFVGNLAWTSDEKRFRQASESFLSAVLRAESGATVTSDEVDQARRTYIPSQWDSAEVRQQKAEARRKALEGLHGVAGRAAPQQQYSPDNPFAR